MGEPVGAKKLSLMKNRLGRPRSLRNCPYSCPLAGSVGRGWHEEPSTAPLSFSDGLSAQGLGSTLQVYPPPQLPSMSQTQDSWDAPTPGLALTLNAEPLEPGVGA